MNDISNTLSSILNSYYESKDADKSTKTDTTNLSKYLDKTSSEDLDSETIFKKISYDVGGNGKSITKDELNSYIEKAQKGSVKISDEELSVLKDVKKNWDTISDKEDSITYSDVEDADYSDKLLEVKPEDETDWKKQLKDFNETLQAEAKATLITGALKSSSHDSESNSLTSKLKSLLTGTTDEKDDENADLIDFLTDLVAKSKTKTTTIETEA